ncbi:MAG TPA: hypothetical protein VG965_01775 [Patescibacteria group bacterium]|nr:hypothetical protein [Patescibacteria group bacterium]
MENPGIPTTMSAGVSHNVKAPVSLEAVRPTVVAPEVSAPKIEAPISIVKPEVVQAQPEAEVSAVSESQKLETLAKEDGVDAALEKFAAGDELSEKPDKHQAEEGEIVDSKTDSDKMTEAHSQTRETVDQGKPRPIADEIRDLTSRVKALTEEKEKAEEKLGKSEELNKLALQSVLEMAQVMGRLVGEKEKDDEEEEGLGALLAALFAAMAKMMQLMFVPQEGDGVLDGQDAEERTMEKMAA